MLPSLELMHHCAPTVAPETIAAIIRVESGGNPYALGINGPIAKRPRPQNATEAAQLARYYIGLGYSVDLGLMQINSQNLKGLGLTLEQVLEPCHNLAAGSRILSRGYAGAVKRYGHGQDALRAALSAYNTGNYERGFHNGYVAKYYGKKGLQVTVQASIPQRPAHILAAAKPKSEKPSLPVDPLKGPPDIYTADSTVYSIWTSGQGTEQ